MTKRAIGTIQGLQDVDGVFMLQSIGIGDMELVMAYPIALAI